MIGNQSQDANRGLRLYGQNERASSTSSGPRWTSTISDLLVNNRGGAGTTNNQIRYKNTQGPNSGGVGVSQSHQTSQHQLLQHQQQQVPSSSAQHLHNLSGAQPNEGSRLMMKLMNGVVAGNSQQLVTHHQPSVSSISGMGVGPGSQSTFDHPRLSGSRDDQKRLALDECTNYLQQKTMQQHFPSTQMAISNIINSNRSGSSAGIQAQQQQTQNGSSTSAAAKKFQAFKFNLTLNKNKALSQQKDSGLQAQQQQQYSSNAFYQAQQMAAAAEQELEDDDAMVINEKHKKPTQAQSRGSSQLAMKQHLKQMIKSYEDQPQLVSSNTDGTQRFDYHQTQQMPQTDQQLTYDNALRSNIAPSGQTLQQPSSNIRIAPGSASSSSKGKPIEKKVHELEERQKIFEEEIIKRVKEIQTYAKTLHMHLKKLQQNQNKKTEDQQMLKDEVSQQIKEMNDIILAVQKQRGNSHGNEISEHAVNDMVDKRLKILDSEVALQIEHLEQKLVKDYESKISRQTRTSQSEMQLLRDELLQDVAQNLKSDIMRQITEKLTKFQDKSQSDLKSQLIETKNQIESKFFSDQQNFQRDILQRQDKLQKQIKDTQTNSDETVAAMSEAIRNEMEGVKKKLQGEIKAEIAKSTSGQREIKDQLDEFQSTIDTLQTQIQGLENVPRQGQQISSERDGYIQELQESLEDQISQIANSFNEHVELQATKNDQIKSIQEAQLQLKQHQSASALTISDKWASIETKLSQMGHDIEDIKQDLDEVRQAVQGQDDTKIDPDNITDQVLEQVKPDIENLNEVTAQISQQVEALKSKISSKSERTELQEVKQEIDSSISRIEKSLTQKLVDVGSQVQNLHVDLDSLVETTNSSSKELSDKQMSIKSSYDQKITQLSADLQSKTDDLYDQLKEVEDRLNSTPQKQLMPIQNQDSTPERKSRVEALAALRASLEFQIGEINQRQDNMVQNRSADKHDTKSALEQLRTQQQELEAKILSKLDQLVDENLDSYNAKVNELDARISAIEEKQFDEPATSGITEEQLEQRAESLSQEFQSSIDIVQNQVNQIEGVLEKQEIQSKEELENLKSDIRGIQELHNCLQDVMVTQEEFSSFKNTAPQTQDQPSNLRIDDLVAQLEELKTENARLAELIASKADQEQIDATQAMVDLHEERIKSLETRKFVPEQNQEINFLSSPRQNEHQRNQGTEHNYQANFLEDLSEAISSSNHQTNRTGTDADMLLFNNQTQSVGRNSMMSNRLGNLVSPIVDRNLQFNSQVSGIAPRVLLETTPIAPDQVDQDDDSHEEQKEESEGEDQIQDSKSSEKLEEKSSSNGDDDSNHPSQGEGIVQEINVSLESPREEEKTPDRKPGDIPINNQKSLNSQKSPQLSNSGNRHKSILFEEESKRAPEVDADANKDSSSEEEFDNEFERGESEKEESEEEGSRQSSQDDQEERKSISSAEDNNQVDPNINLMSPPIQNISVPTTVHLHPPGAPHQANHFVAFESDEEDGQQYDLIPISTVPNSRNNQGPHGTSQSAVLQAAPHNQISAGRNRYFESGSGEEEIAQSQGQSQEEENNQLDNFNVQFQERNDDEGELVPEDQEEGSQEDQPNEEEKDAEYDDSPFDAVSGQRFDQRFEDETDVRRPITSLGRNLREQLEQDNREEDPEIQHIQHETLSSHRTSEMSENNQPDVDISRRSGSPNLDHNNDNIMLGEEVEEDKQSQSPSDFEAEESKIDAVVQSATSVQLVDNLLQDESKEKDPLQEDNQGEEESAGEEKDDDWNLEDVTDPKIQHEALSDDDGQEPDNLREDEDGGNQVSILDNQLDEEEEETKESGETEIKSQILANWIIENEIAKCIAAALSMRSRALDNHDPLYSEGDDEQAEW